MRQINNESRHNRLMVPNISDVTSGAIKMKTRTNAVLVLLAPLFYFNGIHTASAFYDPGAQRWLNRDPIGEQGGVNIYHFVLNNPIDNGDAMGLHPFTGTSDPEISISNPVTIPKGPKGEGSSSMSVWTGNGVPGYLGTGCQECSAGEKGSKKDIKYYDGPICPDGSPQNCQKWLECKRVSPIRLGQRNTGFEWVEKNHCNPCKKVDCG